MKTKGVRVLIVSGDTIYEWHKGYGSSSCDAKRSGDCPGCSGDKMNTLGRVCNGIRTPMEHDGGWHLKEVKG